MILLIAIVWVAVWGYYKYLSPERVPVAQLLTEQEYKKEKPDTSAPGSSPADPNQIDLVLLREKMEQLKRLQSEIEVILESEKQYNTLPPANMGDSITLMENQTDTTLVTKDQPDTATVIQEQIIDTIAIVKKPAEKAKPDPTPVKKVSTPKKPEVPKQEIFVSYLNVYGVNENKNITAKADSVHYIFGNFFIKSEKISSGEFLVVIKNPQGAVITDGLPGTHVFKTADGKRTYSTKVSFDQQNKWVTFYMRVPRLKKGKYSIGIYHKGLFVAGTTKPLR